MSKTKGFLLAAAVAALAFTLSCSSDDGGNDTPLPGTSSDGGTGSSSSDGGGGSSSSGGGGSSSSGGGGSSSSGGTGGNVVNGANEGWIIHCGTSSSGEACEGIIFYSDGRFQFIETMGGVWTLDDAGTYTIDGSTINLLYDEGGSLQFTSYSVSDNSLTATIKGNITTLTRRTGITIGGGSSSSVGGGGNIVYGTVSHGGQDYRTVVIGSQVWMADNLNYYVPGSKCYGEDGQVYDAVAGGLVTLSSSQIQANCVAYGRLYDWATAMDIDASFNTSYWGGSDVNHKGICPTDWHIPNNDDWEALVNHVGTSWRDAGIYLKSASGWNFNNVNGNGTNDYGFSALPGGIGGFFVDGNLAYSGVGGQGLWWSASEVSNDCVERQEEDCGFAMIMMYNSEYAAVDEEEPLRLYSVRCVKNAP